MKLFKRFSERQQKSKAQENLDRNKWRNFIPGDVLEYKGKKILFRGIHEAGGPGMAGIPEPVFGPAHPQETVNIRYYIRPAEGIFAEDQEPVEIGSTGIKIAFLNDPGGLKKVGHITPEEWRALKEGGQKVS